MSALTQLVLPLGLVLLGLAGAAGADRSARLRRPSGDRGDFWSRASWRVCLVLGLPVLLSAWVIALLPDGFAQAGWHLQPDLTGFAGGAPKAAYPWMLLLPWGVWALVLAWGLAESPEGREAGRGLAGTVGFGRSRHWVLFCALPLAAVLAAALPRLGGGPGAYPAATWSTLATLLLSLVGVAFSAGPTPDAGSSPDTDALRAEASSTVLEAWPEALATRGVHSAPVTTWAASSPARSVHPDAVALAEQLRGLGAREIAPELVEAVTRLLRPVGEVDVHGPATLVFAPDDCGQEEVAAAAAVILAHRFHEISLVVTSGTPNEVAERLRRWVPEKGRVTALAGHSVADPTAWIWVTDAETLSDHVLPQLKERSLLRRVGFVVWWGLESYSGVLGANLWAISRRLHRLIRHHGRGDVKTLALIRSTAQGGAQPETFVRRLLPHPFPKDAQIHVPRRFSREVNVHLLTSHTLYFQRSGNAQIPERSRHLPLIAARCSVEAGWPTGLRIPNDAAEAETLALLQITTGGHPLADALVPRRADASAWVEKLAEGEVLSLAEIVAQGGRTAPPSRPHHTGLVLPDNPYVHSLLATLPRHGRGGFDASRRLICAEGHSSILQRHLLLALDEVPDTRSGLLKDFLWEEELIRRVLDRIHFEGKLVRREVRSLNERGELQRDPFYKSSRAPARERRPLGTVGTALIDVRAPEEAQDRDDGIRLRLDPERLTIEAYPHRIFISEGRRYRIREWDPDEVLRRGWLPCRQEDTFSHTWRVRYPYLFNFQLVCPPAGIGRRGKLLTRLKVDLTYNEQVTGVVEQTPDPTTGESEVRHLGLTRPVTTQFTTRAMVLRLPESEEWEALTSLSQVLRHLLPVHLGVEGNALEVVPLHGETLDDLETWGVAIVDLFPGGIGLIDAMSDDTALLLDLLERGRSWLQGCPCANDAGCELCLRSTSALASNPEQAPRRSAGLELLDRLLQ